MSWQPGSGRPPWAGKVGDHDQDQDRGRLHGATTTAHLTAHVTGTDDEVKAAYAAIAQSLKLALATIKAVKGVTVGQAFLTGPSGRVEL